MNKKKSKINFPNIYRFIPAFAKASAGKPDLLWKYFSKLNRKNVFRTYITVLKIFTLCIFIVTVIAIGFDLNKNLQDKRKIDFEREKITKDVKFWESFLEKNKGYRDGYLRLAILEHKLRNLDRARLYLDNALKIDPNFEKAKELDKVLR